MLRGAIVSPDQDLSSRLEQSLADVAYVGVVRSLDHYPDLVELTRVLRAAAPEIVFVSTESMSKAAELVRQVESVGPGIQIIAINRTSNPEVLLEAMRVGIREFLALPFQRQAIHEAITRTAEQLEKRPPTFQSSELVYSFLPSKAGVGTSTLALNVAVAMSRLPETNVMLSDFDLNSGMLRFMLKLDNSYSVADAAEHSMEMDEALWPQLVTSVGSMDVLHAGKLNPNFRIEAAQIRHLIDFMRRNYKALCFDLSGNLEKYSFEIMHESKRVFLVCTPEIPSLHLAREKYAFLKTLDLEDRVSVLVNRVAKRPVITPEQIEQILGLPVFMTFPNDYLGVHRALTAGRCVDQASELGRCCSHLAHALVEKKQTPAATPHKKRFIEYFSIVPNRVSLEQK
jgi:pilus assembly protein CpaE